MKTQVLVVLVLLAKPCAESPDVVMICTATESGVQVATQVSKGQVRCAATTGEGIAMGKEDKDSCAIKLRDGRSFRASRSGQIFSGDREMKVSCQKFKQPERM